MERGSVSYYVFLLIPTPYFKFIMCKSTRTLFEKLMCCQAPSFAAKQPCGPTCFCFCFFQRIPISNSIPPTDLFSPIALRLERMEGTYTDALGVKELLFMLSAKLDNQRSFTSRKESLAQLEHLNQMSRTLSFHLNILNPVNLLPPEILSEIFLLVQGSDAERFPPPMDDGMVGFNSWMAVSQVCQYWRNCALQTPLLWRRVVLGTDVRCPGSLGMLYLERSNPCAFELNLDCSGPNIKNPRTEIQLFQEEIQKARHRISGVHITVDSLYDDALNFLLIRFPSLTSIHPHTRSGPKTQQQTNRLRKFGRPSLPLLFEGALWSNSLTRLSITSRHTPPLAIFNQLTHLAFIQFDTDSSNRSTLAIDDLFKLLAPYARSLKSLYLKDLSHRSELLKGHRKFPPPAPVHLPSLSTVEIKAYYGTFSPYILHRIVIPKKTVMTWKIGTPPFLFDMSEDHHKYQFPPPEHLARVTTMVLRSSEKKIARLSGGVLTVDAPFPKRTNESYRYDWIGPAPFAQLDIPRLDYPWPMANVRHVFVESSEPPDVPRRFWPVFFRTLDALETMEIKGGRTALRGFAQFLGDIDHFRDYMGNTGVNQAEWKKNLAPLLSKVLILIDEKCDATEDMMLMSNKRKPIYVGIWEEMGVASNIHRVQRPDLRTSFTVEIKIL